MIDIRLGASNYQYDRKTQTIFYKGSPTVFLTRDDILAAADTIRAEDARTPDHRSVCIAGERYYVKDGVPMITRFDVPSQYYLRLRKLTLGEATAHDISVLPAFKDLIANPYTE